MTDLRARLVAFAQWIILGAVVGVLCGCASALLLWLLQVATQYRQRHVWIVFTLPLAGLVIGWLYESFGTAIKGGNNLVIETIADNGPRIPARMAPLILIGTVLTHLFGGSAGREGTAVQMGASLADTLSYQLRLNPTLRRHVLVAGVAGGFASVFGTPWAGVVFGLEFVLLGHLAYQAVVPALVAAFVGDLTTRALGIEHTFFAPVKHLAISPFVLGKWLAFAVAVALTATVFIEVVHFIKVRAREKIPRLPLRMALGGMAVVLLWQALGTDAYLGLGVETITRAFHDASVPSFAFALKTLFTAVTVGTGFLGGEVTPLFFVGATLGNALASPLGLPLDMAAAVGMAAVFGSASNTPMALSVMAAELVGANMFPHVPIVCVVAYFLTGPRSVYPAQRGLEGKIWSRLGSVRASKDLDDRQRN